MPDASILDVFPAPAGDPVVIEHTAEEFTSLCPKTGHPDFGVVTLRYRPRPAGEGGVCVELKSLKLYYQSFRDEGIFYEAVTRRICDDLTAAVSPAWLQVITDWRGRGGIRSRIRAQTGEIPPEYRGP
ncbi:MAG: NADPH-dependent 7-cyano-7-deazaguanine reductase QueF [Planctomycetota bacterium]|nr:MAG: NADPH-dependent 7-cyano-7-deazaguanine reductase QueF [Planctomycetota bacterium]